MKEFTEEHLIYLRKSRSDNPHETVEETLARHEQELQNFAKQELGEYIKEDNIYREVISGGEDIDERPEFLKVLHRMEQGNIKGVLVIDTSRLSRAGIYGAGDVINAFEYTHTLIITPFKTYDLKHKFDKKFIEMEMVKSNDYLEYVKEVLDNGKLRSLKNGCFIGSETPYGFSKEKLEHKGYKLVPIEDEVKIIKMIFDLFLEGLGTVALANYLMKEEIKTREGNYFSPNYIRSILTNQHYIGKLVWGKRKTIKVLENGKIVKKNITNENPIIVDGKHDAIISETQFKQAREKLDNHYSANTPRTTEVKNPLAGLVTCKKCGKAMIRKGYVKSKNTTYKRVQEPDKEKLMSVLQEAKQRTGLSLSEIASKIGATKGKVDGWLSPNPDRVYFSKTFAEYWFKLKEVLFITTDEFDYSITTYHEELPHESLVCSNLNCTNVSSRLDIVEEQVLEAIKDHLHEYHYFLDNYEEEITKVIVGNKIQIENIKEKIEKLKKAKKNNLRSYNMEDITREDYLEEKEALEKDIAGLEKKLAKFEEDKEEDKMIKYKKAVPVLEKCVEEYHDLTTPEKNELLRTIVKNVKYSRDKGGRWNEKGVYNFELKVKMLI